MSCELLLWYFDNQRALDLGVAAQSKGQLMRGLPLGQLSHPDTVDTAGSIHHRDGIKLAVQFLSQAFGILAFPESPDLDGEETLPVGSSTQNLEFDPSCSGSHHLDFFGCLA